MPVVSLTRRTSPITQAFMMLDLWQIETFAHSFYPSPTAVDDRRKWVEKVRRASARELTGRVCVRPNSEDLHRYWFAMHGLALTSDEIKDFGHKQNRDLKLAANLLVSCTLGGLSKAQAIIQIARNLLVEDGANSLSSAETTVKRAWRQYGAGCHFVAAKLMMDCSVFEQTSTGLDFATMTTISLAEKLRAMGEATTPRHGSVTVLDPTRMWRMPDWFPLVRIRAINWKNGAGTIEAEMTLSEIPQPLP